MGKFGGVLKGARKARGKTQAEVAVRLKQDQGQISRWEGGKALPLPCEIRSVARVYGVSLPVLLRLYLAEAEQRRGVA
jgi:transcriptional regulator with XRE-family HTH domain